MGYAHIDNLYKSQDVLLFKELFCLEKIDGTSSHIAWKDNQIRFFSGGSKHTSFESLFDKEFLASQFRSIFGGEKVVVFGEAYGGKLQGMSHTYGKELKFVAFDVKVGDAWLSVPQAEETVKRLNLEFVHYKRIPSDVGIIDAQRDANSVQAVRNGMGDGCLREGVVLRPLIELIKNNGERIIAKHKGDAFKERQKVPKVLDPVKLEVLTNAQEIADEWVIDMRLQHILQKNPQFVGMENTKELIKLMVEDVFREAEGEIVESKEVFAAIGKKTAILWKRHLDKALDNS